MFTECPKSAGGQWRCRRCGRRGVGLRRGAGRWRAAASTADTAHDAAAAAAAVAADAPDVAAADTGDLFIRIT